jgi:hypothetical protein
MPEAGIAHTHVHVAQALRVPRKYFINILKIKKPDVFASGFQVIPLGTEHII